jgi:hypothetical protein
MQVVDNQAISVILIVRIIPVPRNRIYRGFLGLLREILFIVVVHAFQSDFLHFFPFLGSKYTGGNLLTFLH